MSRLIWTPGAAAGLERVYTFLAEKDQEAACKALEAIASGTSLLEGFPEAGRPAEDLEPEHRELRIPFGASGYLLLYRIEDSRVYILDLRHQKEGGY